MAHQSWSVINIRKPIGRLRLVAILEGISYLLLGITMPLKYILDIPEPNLFVGMTHGWLFILYIILSLQNIRIYHWSIKISLLILGASLLPFATFFADRILFKPTSDLDWNNNKLYFINKVNQLFIFCFKYCASHRRKLYKYIFIPTLILSSN